MFVRVYVSVTNDRRSTRRGFFHSNLLNPFSVKENEFYSLGGKILEKALISVVCYRCCFAFIRKGLQM